MNNVKLQNLRGMHDLIHEQYDLFTYITDKAKYIADIYNFDGIATPMVEYTNVFDRSLGDTSDVVQKEMYNFIDKSGNNICLRPEFTASIVRAVISNKMLQQLPLKLFSYGPVFRYDRPQKGRQRQFHQVNFEYIGSDNVFSDAEIIRLARDYLHSLNIKNFTLEVNSLGCKDSQDAYQAELMNFFAKYYDDLSDTSKIRFDNKKPLRILDSKDKFDKKISSEAPLISDYYSDYAKKYFDQLLNYLALFDIDFKVNSKLMRGLDYYSHTAFEFITDDLGAQGTIAAGGRYDSLFNLMGAQQDVPAIGFAAGVERLMLMQKLDVNKDYPIILLPLEDKNIDFSVKILNLLRDNKIKSDIYLQGKVQKRLIKAIKNQAAYVIFIGQNEQENNSCLVKDIKSQTETLVAVSKLVGFLNGKLGGEK